MEFDVKEFENSFGESGIISDGKGDDDGNANDQ